MPAAYKAWRDRQIHLVESVAEDIDDEFSWHPEEQDELGPLVTEIVRKVELIGDYKTLRDNDSKYEALRSRLRELIEAHEGIKIVVFSYFKPTLSYLKDRLDEDGIPAFVQFYQLLQPALRNP